MKIALITNTFSDYLRQKIAVDSWIHLKSLYPDLQLINAQFSEDYNIPTPYPELETRYVLSNTQKKIPNATKNLPLVKELFQCGIHTDAEYFIITNSDVIIMPSLIQTIIENKPVAWACSRLDIEPIDSFQRILDKNVKPVRYEIAGFDVYSFQKEWAINNIQLFSDDFVLGKPLWDVAWAGYCKIFGENFPIGNGFPPHCFHIHHGIGSVMQSCPERDWNIGVAKNTPMTTLMINAMVFNLTQNLMRRTPAGSFLIPKDNELVIEKVYFDCLNIHRNLL